MDQLIKDMIRELLQPSHKQRKKLLSFPLRADVTYYFSSFRLGYDALFLLRK